ncbi:hypothetical protein [Paraflavitalea speifideaquila]|uniref:hypothetical protein n=1 Tax=Paraflavitalea speifideaquila TaxID=3076558 RepID=UPI0028E8C339|nr:hypothetical protein [Paraflavitalea speifideiaquila]
MKRTMREEYVVNPLYNARLNNIFETKNFSFQNNLQLTYQLSADLDLRGAIQVSKGLATR